MTALVRIQSTPFSPPNWAPSSSKSRTARRTGEISTPPIAPPHTPYTLLDFVEQWNHFHSPRQNRRDQWWMCSQQESGFLMSSSVLAPPPKKTFGEGKIYILINKKKRWKMTPMIANKRRELDVWAGVQWLLCRESSLDLYCFCWIRSIISSWRGLCFEGCRLVYPPQTSRLCSCSSDPS